MEYVMTNPNTLPKKDIVEMVTRIQAWLFTKEVMPRGGRRPITIIDPDTGISGADTIEFLYDLFHLNGLDPILYIPSGVKEWRPPR